MQRNATSMKIDKKNWQSQNVAPETCFCVCLMSKTTNFTRFYAKKAAEYVFYHTKKFKLPKARSKYVFLFASKAKQPQNTYFTYKETVNPQTTSVSFFGLGAVVIGC